MTGGHALAAAPGAESAGAIRERARAAFVRGRSLYQLTQYQQALEAFVEAYTLLEEPAFIFNVAQCHRQLGHAEDAVRAYQSFLALAPPNDSGRADALQHVRTLETAIAAQRSEAERSRRLSEELALEQVRAARERTISERLHAQASHGDTSPRRVRAFIVSGSVLGFTGLGLIGGGISSALGITQARNDLQQQAATGAIFDASIERRYNRDVATTAALFSVGGALVITGAALLGRELVEHKRRERVSP